MSEPQGGDRRILFGLMLPAMLMPMLSTMSRVSLPIVREITLESALVRPLSLPLLERQLRDRAERLQSLFEAAVGPVEIGRAHV